MLLDEKQNEIYRGINTKVKINTENKFQNYEVNNTCSPKNSFLMTNLININNLNSNKNELRNSILSTEANLNSVNNSKMRNSFEKLTTDFLRGNQKSSQNKYTNNNNYYENFNNQNTNSNLNNNVPNSFTSNNTNAISYKDLLLQQQENRIAKLKKEKILSLLDEKSTFDKKTSSERNSGKNYFTSNYYRSQSKNQINSNFENNKNFNTILNENPDIKMRLNTSHKNGLINNTYNYNIENFGLVATSNNSSFNMLNNNSNININSNNNSNNLCYNNTNAGKEFSEFLKNNKSKDFQLNSFNSPLKPISNYVNNNYINNLSNRSSLKNLNAVKSQLESLFEKNDKENNNAMENLCAFLNHKNKKTNGANIQQTDKSVKLMEEIKHMR